jgi:hypothetical protein
MKSLFVVGFCAISLSIVGCAGESGSEDTGGTESDVVSQLGENEVMTCGDTQALVGEKAGKATLVTLKKSHRVYALSGKTDKLSTLQAGLHSCKKVSGADAATWAVANGLVTYEGEIDGLASTVTDEMSSLRENEDSSSNQSSAPNAYVVFAIETSKRDSLDLGTKARNSAGKLPASDDDSLLDENDYSYGGMSAAYDLGGGEDYGEWFQGASDGISLESDVTSALDTNKAGFIAHEKVKGLEDVTDGTNAIELTVGAWTFLIPDGFSK